MLQTIQQSLDVIPDQVFVNSLQDARDKGARTMRYAPSGGFWC